MFNLKSFFKTFIAYNRTLGRMTLLCRSVLDLRTTFFKKINNDPKDFHQVIYINFILHTFKNVHY